ncbi:T9SS type A sorting domain-containing protein [Niastella caeni]|uniref:T9SS type A sorting domain-containing protein n=1 Tax=Niastella caeni TaxID=2569763 RepID=A0A4S8HI20_9BACT|nr:T9SS type A sorting domain-containing protein [Niastella caeni]THU34171.1 T9SS type A sorting domain-containing protein [Niastella caeni]
MQKRIPKRFTLLMFFFLLSNYLSASPDCPILTGEVTTVDGTTFKEKGPCTVSAINVTAAAGNGGELTCTNPSLGLSATATGSGTTTWNWSGPNGYTSTQQNPTITTAGTYTVVATNSTGTGSASVTVTENKTAPDITAIGGTQACSRVIALTANSTVSEVTYSWTGPNGFTSNEKDPSVSVAGTYTVLVTNPANGCSNQQSVSATAGAAIPATLWLEDFNGLSNGATSDAGATAWTATASGGGTYAVQNNEFKTSFSSQKEGVWTSQEINISGKKNVYISVDLRSEATPNHSFNTLDYIRIYFKLDGGEEILAFEDLAGIDSSTTGTASTTFDSWALRGSTLQVIIKTNNSADNERYYFDNIKVAGSDFVTENVTATGSITSCAPLSITLSGNEIPGVVIYTWTGPNNFFSSGVRNQNLVVTEPGIYTLDVKNWSTGCSGTDTAVVILDNSGPGACASASGILSCTGTSSVTLSGSSSTSGVTYSWTGLNNFTSAAQNPVVTTVGPYNLTVTDPATGCTSTATVNVTTSISTEATATDILTCTRNSVDLTGSSPATSPVNYSWTGPGNFTSIMQNPSATAEGIYTLTVTDPSTGCIASDTALVSLNNTPPGACASAFGTLDCNSGSSANLYGSSSTSCVTYSWTGPNNFTSDEQNPVVTVGGTYNLTVTDPVNGCTSTASVTITVSNTKTSTWLEDFTGLPDGTISDAGATPWTTSKTVSAAEIAVHNNQLRITNCTTTGEVVWTSGAIDVAGKTGIRITAGIRSSVINGAVMNRDPVYGDYIRIYYKLDNGNEVLFHERTGDINWHGENPAHIAVGPDNGNYNTLQVIVRARAIGNDEFYYFDNLQVVATEAANISASATGGTINCINNSVALQGSSAASGVSYTWSGTDGYTSNAQNPVVNTPGTYTLTVASGSCTGTATATVIMDTTKPNIATPSHAGIITCTTPSIGIMATISTPNLVYRWSGPDNFSATTLNASVTRSGTYIFTATNPNNGCYDTAITVVDENTARPGEISINNSGTITCLTKNVTISGSSTSSGVNYRWEGPNNYSSNSSSATVTRGGTYTLTATNPQNGCTSSKPTTVAENTTAPVINITNTSPISCANPTVNLTANNNTMNATYLWLGPEDYVAVTKTIEVNIPGTYIITVTNPANGCLTTDFAEVTEDYSDCAARRSANVVTEKAAEQNTPVTVVTSFTHKAYPNPVITNGVIEFTTPQSANATVGIYNALGTCEKVLFKGNVTAGRQYRVAVPATQLSAGAYYYIINTGSKTYTGKLVIVK